jgi:pimeloyl-ACP methyl ester carboxylesterase
LSREAAVTRSSRDVVANGIRIRVHEFKHASPKVLAEPRTLLLLHGFLDAGSTWDLVAEPLTAAGYQVFAPDLRGFGESGWVPPGGYYHFADYVADVDGLVGGLVPEGRWLGLIGHSMGGTVASLWAGTRPERLARLIDIEGIGPAAEEPEHAVARMRAWLRDLARIERVPRPLASMDEAVAKLAATHPRIDREIIRSRAELLVTKNGDGRIAWANDPLHRSISPTPFQPEAFKAFLGAIACPTLFVSGGPTGWHPPDEDVRLGSIKNLVRLDIPDAGHMLHWTRPVELAEASVQFLS